MAHTHALLVDGAVRQLFDADPGLPPEWRVIDVSAYPNVAEGWVVDKKGKVSEPPPPVETLPALLTRGQAAIQLSRMAGSTKTKSLLDDANDKVPAQGGELAVWFAHEGTWRRTSAYLGQFAKLVGWTDDDADAFFRDAAKITV